MAPQQQGYLRVVVALVAFSPLLGGLAGLLLPACSTDPSCTSDDPTWCAGPNGTSPANGTRDNGETDVDCGGPTAAKCAAGKSCLVNDDCESKNCPPGTLICREARSDDGIQNGTETDVDCGGASAPKCAESKSCVADSDCNGACNYAKKCISAPSCKPHLGGDTCGKGEVGESDAVHESCCRTLPVPGYTDPKHPGKAVTLDKYEITAGRVRAFIEDMRSRTGGKPDIKAWIAAHPPAIWDPAWNDLLPSDEEGGTITVAKELLGDTRPGAESPPPDADQVRKLGTNFQFNGQLLVYVHGNNCSTHVGSYGFPTFFYPAAVLAKTGPLTFPPRVDGLGPYGTTIPASEHLEVKSMNCISNALLTAFCHWDGGQLATDEVLDFVTGSPPSLGNAIGCGTQRDDVGTGGRCADRAAINATYDAGRHLPEDRPELNPRNYSYPGYAGSPDHDSANQIAAPGRANVMGVQADVVRINPGDEPWMDLHGNLNEVVLDMQGATFTGKFGLKYRGIGYSSARSELNVTPDASGVKRLERPETRAGYAGGRCMRFR